ncbi:MAG: formylmethanofuran dehydrogenase subunit E family protein [Candidatus Bathyarchaeia archaeon]
MLDESLVLEIKKAENLHGHLGPFLVLGVKMANLAKKRLNIDRNNHRDMQVFVELPLTTPFSCILDGIQAATQCTIGNRRLRVKNFNGEITALFKIKGQNKTVKVRLNPQIRENIWKQLSEGVSGEKIAWEVAATPENQLFVVEKDKHS